MDGLKIYLDISDLLVFGLWYHRLHIKGYMYSTDMLWVRTLYIYIYISTPRP